MIVNREMSKTEIESRISQLVTQYDRWSFDIPLPYGIKGKQCKLETSPAANTLKEDWPEDCLTYAYEPGYKKIIRKLTPPVLWTLLRRIYRYVISAYRK